VHHSGAHFHQRHCCGSGNSNAQNQALFTAFTRQQRHAEALETTLATVALTRDPALDKPQHGDPDLVRALAL
jgi:hypothetical protein